MGFDYKTTILLTSCSVPIVKPWQNIANMYHILYKYRSCVSQKRKICCQLNLSKHDALHQSKHSVHYWFPLHIHSSFFIVSVLTLQSPICVSICICLSYFSSSEWLIDLCLTSTIFAPTVSKSKYPYPWIEMASSYDLEKKPGHLTSLADTGQGNYQNCTTRTLLAKSRWQGYPEALYVYDL